MNAEQIEQLRRRMSEVAALPHDDPQRQGLVQQISEIDGALEQEWLALVAEDERLRLDLARIVPPADLENRLLAITQQVRPQRAWFSRPSGWFFALAAVLVLGFALWAVTAMQGHRVERSLDHVAMLTLASHESQPRLAIQSSDWQTVYNALHRSVPYPMDRPKLDASFKLIGGTVLTLAGNTVVHTCWEKEGRMYSLFQFCGKDFGIHAAIDRRESNPAPNASATVMIWTEGHCDYALVRDEENVTPATSRSA